MHCVCVCVCVCVSAPHCTARLVVGMLSIELGSGRTARQHLERGLDAVFRALDGLTVVGVLLPQLSSCNTEVLAVFQAAGFVGFVSSRPQAVPVMACNLCIAWQIETCAFGPPFPLYALSAACC
jgi:hypothetical protein